MNTQLFIIYTFVTLVCLFQIIVLTCEATRQKHQIEELQGRCEYLSKQVESLIKIADKSSEIDHLVKDRLDNVKDRFDNISDTLDLYKKLVDSLNDGQAVPTEYGKYVDECLNEASKHFFSEGEDKYSVADLFYAGVRCGKSCLEKQIEPKEVDLELNSFDATVCKIGSTYLKEMDRDAIAKALKPYKDGDKVKVIIKAQKGE